MTSRRVRLLGVPLRFASATWLYVRGITRKAIEIDILLLASGLAFNGILAMIPLMLLTASAIGSFLNSSALGLEQLNQVLNALFPPEPFALRIKDSVMNMISDMVIYRRSLGIVGVLVLVWTATSLFDALRSALHRIYALKRTKGLIASFLHDVGFVLVAFVLFLASNFAIWVISFLDRMSGTIPALGSLTVQGLNKFIPTMIVIALTALMFYIVYRHMADSKPPKGAAVISTLTTTVVWVVSGKLFAIYLSNFSTIGSVYGPYAFFLVLMLWIYYSSITFVLGGIMGQVYWERLKAKHRQASSADPVNTV